MNARRQDAITGGIFIAIGGGFALASLQLELGTLLRMGPGFFPLLLGIVLAALGLVVVLRATDSLAPHREIPWRGLLLVLGAPVVFGLTIRGLGLVPAVGLAALLSCYASRRMSHAMALALAVLLAIFCAAVFSYGLGLPIARFGPWLRFG